MAYNLACAAAKLGRKEMLAWLRFAVLCSTATPRRRASSDPDFADWSSDLRALAGR
ncbi:MAG: hypothetical protein R3F59_02950 [Myxococcota bacterium]